MGIKTTKSFFFTLLTVGTFFCHLAQAIGEDPYANIETFTLKNGLTVVLAPSGAAETIEVELRVLTGKLAERNKDRGVAHLTARTVVRDPVGYGETYEERIREETGGRSSVATQLQSTSFTSSVPSRKGLWVLNEFSRMLLNRTFAEPAFATAKENILEEAGAELGGPLRTILSYVNPLRWNPPDFFETEFGVPGKNAAPDVLRRTTLALKLIDVQGFYNRFYTPQNMVLFVAGPFRTAETEAFIKHTFGPFQNQSKETLPSPVPVPRQHAFIRSRLAKKKGRIHLGTKFWNIEAKDELALDMYFRYLAFRMKRRLTARYQVSYGALAKVWALDKFGYATISLEVPLHDFTHNLNYVKDLLHRETIRKAFEDDDIAQARALYTNSKYYAKDGASQKARLASELYTFQKTYGTKETPYETFQSLTNDELRERLAKLVQPEREYLKTEEPHLVFPEEFSLIAVLAALISLIILRQALLGPFHHTAIRYVRKIKYHPAFDIIALCLFTGFLWFVFQGLIAVDRLLLNWNFFQSSFVMSHYLEGALLVGTLMALAISYMCLIPRKVMVVGNSLIIKSLTYYAARHRLTSISGIRVCRPHQLLTGSLFSFKLRWYHLSPWRKGVLIQLKNGQSYYLSFSNVERTAEELRDLVGISRQEEEAWKSGTPLRRREDRGQDEAGDLPAPPELPEPSPEPVITPEDLKKRKPFVKLPRKKIG